MHALGHVHGGAAGLAEILISSCDFFYADPDYPINSYVS